jgi:threonine/homoserine/homoserine lactone efflux protein
VRSLIGDSVWAILALTGAAAFIQNLIARLLLSFLGIGFLAYLAVKAIQDSRKDIVYESAMDVELLWVSLHSSLAGS